MFRIDEDFVLLDVEATSADELIRFMCKELEAAGCIQPEHVDTVLEREQKFPTGLPTKPFCVALPHGEPHGVNESALCFARLKKPVVFKNMGNACEDLDVRMVFLLVNNSSENQVEALRNLSEMFGESEKLSTLALLENKKDVAKMLSNTILK